VVEGAALEMLFTLPGNEGSNPSLSVDSRHGDPKHVGQHIAGSN
jgi:hypothetical protein